MIRTTETIAGAAHKLFEMVRDAGANSGRLTLHHCPQVDDASVSLIVHRDSFEDTFVEAEEVGRINQELARAQATIAMLRSPSSVISGPLLTIVTCAVRYLDLLEEEGPVSLNTACAFGKMRDAHSEWRKHIGHPVK